MFNTFPLGTIEAAYLPLIHIRASEHEKPALPASHPWHQLREQVRDHHPQARLNVLQSEVLRPSPAVHAEARFYAGHIREEVADCSNERVHVQINVVAEFQFRSVNHYEGKGRGDAPADRVGKILGALACVQTRVFRTHVAGVEDAVRELAGIARHVGRPRLLARDTSRVLNDLFVYDLHHQQWFTFWEDRGMLTPLPCCLGHETAHGKDYNRRRTTVNAAT